MRTVRLCGALLVTALAGCSLSNNWVLPDTPEARECGAACREGHSACVDGKRGNAELRGPVAGSTEDHGVLEREAFGPSLYGCQEQMDRCLSVCPGARKKE